MQHNKRIKIELKLKIETTLTACPMRKLNILHSNMSPERNTILIENTNSFYMSEYQISKTYAATDDVLIEFDCGVLYA